MKTIRLSMLIVAVLTPVVLCAQQTPSADSSAPNAWTKVLADKSKRGTLHDATQTVRGDAGKWSDEPPQLSHVSPLIPPGAKIPLDVRLDQVLEQKPSDGTTTTTSGCSSARVKSTTTIGFGVERIERKENEFTIVLE